MNPEQDRAGFCRGNRGNRGWINWDGPGNPAPANRLAHAPAGIRTSKRENQCRKRRFIPPSTDFTRGRMPRRQKGKSHPAQYPNVQAGKPVPKTAVYPAVDGFAAGQNGCAAKKGASSDSVPERPSGSACPENGGLSRRRRISRGAARPRRQKGNIVPFSTRTSKRERLSRKRRFIPPLADFTRGSPAASPKRKSHPVQYPNVPAGEPVPKTAVHPAVGGFHAGQPGRAAKKGTSSGSVPERPSGSACLENGGSSRRWRISRGAARPRRQQKRIFFCDLLDIPRNI